MPDLNNIEVVISGQKFKVQSDESKEYIKKIEEMINKKIDNFKDSNKKFDNYSSLVFTSFLLADKYLKLVDKLEEVEDNKVFIPHKLVIRESTNQINNISSEEVI